MSHVKRVKLTTVVGDVVQSPKAYNLAGGKGATGDDDFAGELHAALRVVSPALVAKRVVLSTAE